MTDIDDWTRFCLMMAAAGWEWRTVPEDDPTGPVGFWTHRNGCIYTPAGTIAPGGRREGQAGNWRTWLEAGQSPPPY